jgi:hypothetical protein
MQKIAQDNAISLDSFILSKNHNERQKKPKRQKITQSGHPGRIPAM